MKTKLYPLAVLLVAASCLSACDKIAPESYYSRGNPEDLLDQSTEVVNFDLSSYNALEDMLQWVNQDQPSRAELYCEESDPICMEAEEVLAQFGVPVIYGAPEGSNVTLVYDRVVARDCENRYIDNSVNPYNLPHPTFGCSTASNVLQMVTDKRQFTSPALLELHDAERVERVMDGYKLPYSTVAPEIDSNFSEELDIRTDSQ